MVEYIVGMHWEISEFVQLHVISLVICGPAREGPNKVFGLGNINIADRIINLQQETKTAVKEGGWRIRLLSNGYLPGCFVCRT